jgi:hypothetical protein
MLKGLQPGLFIIHVTKSFANHKDGSMGWLKSLKAGSASAAVSSVSNGRALASVRISGWR